MQVRQRGGILFTFRRERKESVRSETVQSYTIVHSNLARSHLVCLRRLEDTAVIGDVCPLYLRAARGVGVKEERLDLVFVEEGDVRPEVGPCLVRYLCAGVKEPDVGIRGLVPPADVLVVVEEDGVYVEPELGREPEEAGVHAGQG